MNTEQRSAPGKASIQVIERMALLLDILASHPETLNLKEIARLAVLHPSTTHRILSNLVSQRLVDRDETGAYLLGLRLLELGNIVKSRINIRSIAAGYLAALHRITGQTVNLSIRQGDEIVYIDRTYSEASGMQVVRAIGGHVPLHLTSTGKLFLAADSPEEIRAYAARTKLKGSTPNSITNLAQLQHELIEVCANNFARDNEELEPGVRCFAAGILDDAGVLVAGLSISAPSDRLQEKWGEDLKQAAAQISVALGFVS